MIEGGGVPLWLAFIAGLLSFASACVLPIVPGYGVLITGIALSDRPRASHGRLGAVVRYALLFLLGFGLLFVLSAATATSVGDWVRGRLALFEAIGAIAIGLLGLALVGRAVSPVFAKWLRGTRWSAAAATASVVGGAGFAAAWTPCIGPVLAEILLYGTFAETLGEGVLLLAVYTVGLGTPFLALGLAIGWLLGRSTLPATPPAVLQGTLGVVLLVFGGLLLTGRFASMTAYLSGFGVLFDVGL